LRALASAEIVVASLRLESARVHFGRNSGLSFWYYLRPAHVSRHHDGYFQQKMNKEGAISGMLARLFVTLFYVFAHKGSQFFIKGN
jgi:hypothetical protein